MSKDAFITTNFVLVPITSLSQSPMSQDPGSRVPGSRVSGSRVPGLGSQVSGPDFRQCRFTEHLQWLILTVPGFQPATLLKKRLWQRSFTVNFAKFLRTSFLLIEHLRMTASCVVFICEF